MQSSGKMWGVAAHVVMAAAQQRGWEFGDHRSLKAAVQRLAQESGDESLSGDFIAADHFHADLYHKFMQDYEIDDDRLMVRRFVERMQA